MVFRSIRLFEFNSSSQSMSRVGARHVVKLNKTHLTRKLISLNFSVRQSECYYSCLRPYTQISSLSYIQSTSYWVIFSYYLGARFINVKYHWLLGSVDLGSVGCGKARWGYMHNVCSDKMDVTYLEPFCFSLFPFLFRSFRPGFKRQCGFLIHQ